MREDSDWVDLREGFMVCLGELISALREKELNLL